MSRIDAFAMPQNNKTVVLAVSAANQTVAIPGNGEFLSLTNQGAAGGVIICVETTFAANPAAAALATSMPILGGQTRIVRRADLQDAISVIGSAAGPTNLSVTPGTGT